MTTSGHLVQQPAWTFEHLSGEAAAAVASACSTHPFQNPRWVCAAAAARGRPHEFTAVRAERRGWPPAYLFGGLHRRAGVVVFESMPMGGYGGWACEQGLPIAEEAQLNLQWLRGAHFHVVRLTSEPGRAAALPPAPLWPVPAFARQHFEGRDFTTHLLDLSADDATRLQRVKPNVRSYLRRVDSLGFSFEIGGADALSDFCSWYRRGSQAWQSAAGTLLPDAFFEALQGPGSMEVWRARRDGQVVAAALFLLGRLQVQYQASGSAKLAGPVSAMDALIWAAARHYHERGLQSMNMGASEGLDSVRRFKEKFGAQAVGYRCETYLLPRWARRLGLAANRKGGP